MSRHQLLKENAYVLSHGPSARDVSSLFKVLSAQPLHDCKFQRYQFLPERRAFAGVFTGHTYAIVNFTYYEPHPNCYSPFPVRLYGQVETFRGLNELSSNDHIIELLQDPELEFQLDYDYQRSLGVIREITARCDWATQNDVLPFLLTAINRDETSTSPNLRVIIPPETTFQKSRPPVKSAHTTNLHQFQAIKL